MTINITKANDRIVVSDGVHTYSVLTNEVGRNQYGNEAELTWGEAFEANLLQVQDDEQDGQSYGMHGALYIQE